MSESQAAVVQTPAFPSSPGQAPEGLPAPASLRAGCHEDSRSDLVGRHENSAWHGANATHVLAIAFTVISHHYHFFLPLIWHNLRGPYAKSVK